ncbi:hypothetical protein B0F87_104335 [Methylobacter tundripaludum]|uniref:Uncharacterized protein n=1 Tax=Methylobacter tundripaludum TaxID=173365 RepID=A0A2S6HFT0_9GAMM|nr:hypothetical protein B0F87_104335 [Methylobacter tundripaludum]
MHQCPQVSGKDTRAVFAQFPLLPKDGFVAMGVQALLALAGEACTPPIRADSLCAGYPQKMCVTMSTGVWSNESVAKKNLHRLSTMKVNPCK